MDLPSVPGCKVWSLTTSKKRTVDPVLGSCESEFLAGSRAGSDSAHGVRKTTC